MLSRTRPPHAEDCLDPLEPAATSPVFRSPRNGQVFVASAGGSRVPVEVLTLDEASGVRLLVDGRDAGRPAVVTLPPGFHTLTAIDGRERVATVRIRVRTAGPKR